MSIVVWYHHDGEKEEFGNQISDARSPEDAVRRTKRDRNIGCRCCDPLTITRVEVWNGRWESVEPPKGKDWNSL